MPSSFSYEEANPSKSKGCPRWQVWVACSLLIAIGLGVGLGVGLSNQKVAAAPETTTTTPVKTTSVIQSTTSAEATTQPLPDNGPWLNYRLPNYIIPSHYNLTLNPNMATDLYTGSNAMTLSITQETKYILVHVDDELNVTATRLAMIDGTEINVVREFRYPLYEFYVIEAENNLLPGDYILTLDFQGSLIGKIVGLYKSDYTDPTDGTSKAMVGSDMEPTDARKAYPCFDEPALKIMYTTTLVHQPGHVALSNMDEDYSVTRDDGLIATTFRKSVPMSTYLGCFAIGEFTYIEERSKKNNIPLRVYIPPFQLPTGRANYSLTVMKDVFDFFEEYFAWDYSLPKCDMISIPNFGTGAMENWGLITYRETNLLWDPVQSSTSNKQRVAAVVAHELVHQWFGNIVTMKWWDNIWLNEGFASFFEYIGMQQAEPEWKLMSHFVIDDLQPVMRVDSVVTSHPIVVPVESPSEITSVFDSISYSKGATVLRMMRDILGEEDFIGGIRNYLRRHIYGNADEMDLWADVQEYIDANSTSTINITATMDPWIRQMGFPIIIVENDLTATQTHFLTDPNADLSSRPSSPYNYAWNVDISHTTSANTSAIERQTMAIDSTNTALNIAVADGEWFKLNPGETGYYRVNYVPEMWTNISERLLTNHSEYPEVDRSNLVDDAFNLAAAGYISYTQALNITRYLDQEYSYFVWDSFSAGSSYIRIMLENTQSYSDFKEYYRNKVKPVADYLGWNASFGTHEEKLNRYVTLALALRYDDVDALNNATELFTQWIADSSFFVHPDIRQLVYRYGLPAENATDEWNIMLERYTVEQVASEKTNLLRGLTSTEDVVLIDRMLEYSKNESIILSQDFFNCITYISYTPTGNRMSWAWVQLNWEYMVDRFGIEDRNLGRLVPNIVSDYNTELQLWEVESFFERYPEAGAGESGRLNAVNEIKTNIKWMEQNQAPIAMWLQDQLPVL